MGKNDGENEKGVSCGGGRGELGFKVISWK